jgi:hypothetical protein
VQGSETISHNRPHFLPSFREEKRRKKATTSPSHHVTHRHFLVVRRGWGQAHSVVVLPLLQGPECIHQGPDSSFMELEHHHHR